MTKRLHQMRANPSAKWKIADVEAVCLSLEYDARRLRVARTIRCHITRVVIF
jgi:hypothetical protein